MYTATASVLYTCLAQACFGEPVGHLSDTLESWDSIRKVADTFVDKLFDRTLQIPPAHLTDLDATVAAKPLPRAEGQDVASHRLAHRLQLVSVPQPSRLTPRSLPLSPQQGLQMRGRPLSFRPVVHVQASDSRHMLGFNTEAERGTTAPWPAAIDAHNRPSEHGHASTDALFDRIAAGLQAHLEMNKQASFTAPEAAALTGSGGIKLALSDADGAPLAVGAKHIEFVVLMMVEVEVYCDVLIVGGGPAGCTCALYTSRADLKTVIVDKNPGVGALAITSTIANYPGVETTMSGAALLDKMRDQAIAYGTEYHRAQVFMVDAKGENKTVYTPEATFHTKALVLASGAMGRKPTIKGEDTYLGRGVSYCATCDGAFYRDSEVCVFGTDQEAIEEAEYLTKFASTIHWITPTAPKNEALAERLLSHPNVRQWKETRLLSIDGDDSGVTSVQVQQRGTDAPVALPVEGAFVYVAGALPIMDFLEKGCVELNEDGGVKVDAEMATSMDGVFAIGDIRNTPYKQVVVAASDGCIAAMAIDKFLKGRKNVRVDWIHK